MRVRTKERTLSSFHPTSPLIQTYTPNSAPIQFHPQSTFLHFPFISTSEPPSLSTSPAKVVSSSSTIALIPIRIADNGRDIVIPDRARLVPAADLRDACGTPLAVRSIACSSAPAEVAEVGDDAAADGVEVITGADDGASAALGWVSVVLIGGMKNGEVVEARQGFGNPDAPGVHVQDERVAELEAKERQINMRIHT
jgi:hypothetical protein